MATIGRTRYKLETDTTDFDKGMANAKKKIETFATSTSGVLGKLASPGGMLLGGLGFGAVGTALSMITDTAESKMDRLLEVSDKTEKLMNSAKSWGLSTRQMSGLDFVTKMNGGDEGALDKFLSSILEITSSAEKLKQIGLDEKDVLGKTTAEKVDLVADAYGRLGSEAKRAMVGIEQFGKKNFANADNILRLGSKGIADQIKMGADNGVIVTNEVAEKLDQKGDSAALLKLKEEAREKRKLAEGDFWGDFWGNTWSATKATGRFVASPITKGIPALFGESATDKSFRETFHGTGIKSDAEIEAEYKKNAMEQVKLDAEARRKKAEEAEATRKANTVTNAFAKLGNLDSFGLSPHKMRMAEAVKSGAFDKTNLENYGMNSSYAERMQLGGVADRFSSFDKLQNMFKARTEEFNKDNLTKDEYLKSLSNSFGGLMGSTPGFMAPSLQAGGRGSDLEAEIVNANQRLQVAKPTEEKNIVEELKKLKEQADKQTASVEVNLPALKEILGELKLQNNLEWR